MEKQTIIWTVLPDGIQDGKARLSVVISPRLQADDDQERPLQVYPDFIDWPRKIQGAGFQVLVSGQVVPADVAGNTAPELWRALFPAQTTFVKPHVYADLRGRPFVRFPAAELYDKIKQHYTDAALAFTAGLPGAHDLNDFRKLGLSGAVKQKIGQLLEGVSPDKIPNQLDITPEEKPVVEAYLFYHRSKPRARPNPARLMDLNQFEFHEVLAALRDYPWLLRKLGLVIDLIVPADHLPPSGTLRVLPTLPDALSTATVHFRPATAYVKDKGFRSQESSRGIAGRLLALDTPGFSALQVDVDSAVFKLQALVDNLDGLQQATDMEDRAEGVPTLRAGGIAVVRDNRAQQILGAQDRQGNLEQALQVVQKLTEAATTAAPETRAALLAKIVAIESETVLHAEDLVAGYRVDILDQRTGQWRSLHERVGHYRFFGPHAPHQEPVADEGFVRPSVTQEAPDAEPLGREPRPVYAHDALFHWDGWSLAAPRPGKSLDPQSTVKGPAYDAEAVVNDPAALAKQGRNRYNMAAWFTARRLPALRFGRSYDLRVRLVDLAGNSASLDEAGDAHSIQNITYLRYEPVSPPVVVPREDFQLPVQPGESLERLVVRSDRGTQADAYAATFAGFTHNPGYCPDRERHLVPPKTTQQMAELHGKFDNPATGRLRGDQQTYDLACREAGALGAVHPKEQIDIPYLPDPLARGVAFLNLPGVPVGCIGRIGPDGQLKYEQENFEQSLTLIDFGDDTDWPYRVRAFRLRLIGIPEGQPPSLPCWDPQARVLDVELQQGRMADVQYSCYMHDRDLEVMGIAQWIKEKGATRVYELARLGRHWMLTPYRTLHLVHAVQRPLHDPVLTIGAEKDTVGDTFARLTCVVKVDSHSTAKADLRASWEEWVDDLAKPRPERRAGQSHVFDCRTDTDNGVQSFARVADTDTRLRHEFGDTRYRRVTYDLVATTRFREYFTLPAAAAAGFTIPSSAVLLLTAGSQPVTVDVPNSARPLAPGVIYAVPTFVRSQQRLTPISTELEHPTSLRARRRGGLRVYLARPWYSSGDGELLAVVLPPNPTSSEQPDSLKPYVTRWGRDPLWVAGMLPSFCPDLSHFPNRVRNIPEQATLEEIPNQAVRVACFPVEYDETRQLYYADIDMDTGQAYFPFVRLALARFQPISLPGAHLSRVVLAEFMQVTPDRLATVVFKPRSSTDFTATVTGAVPEKHQGASILPSFPNVIEFRVERQVLDRSDLGWEAVDALLVRVQPVFAQAGTPKTDYTATWQASFQLPAPRTSARFRLVIQEAETHFLEPERVPFPAGSEFLPPATSRVVYTEVFDL